jgi:hypothetical protein
VCYIPAQAAFAPAIICVVNCCGLAGAALRIAHESRDQALVFINGIDDKDVISRGS